MSDDIHKAQEIANAVASHSWLLGDLDPDSERLASILRTMAELVTDSRLAAHSGPIAVSYLTCAELAEWAMLVVDDVQTSDGTWPNRPTRVDHEHGLGQVSAARAREEGFRILAALPLAIEQRVRLWADLHAVCWRVYSDALAPAAATVDLVRILVGAFDPLVKVPDTRGHPS